MTFKVKKVYPLRSAELSTTTPNWDLHDFAGSLHESIADTVIKLFLYFFSAIRCDNNFPRYRQNILQFFFDRRNTKFLGLNKHLLGWQSNTLHITDSTQCLLMLQRACLRKDHFQVYNSKMLSLLTADFDTKGTYNLSQQDNNENLYVFVMKSGKIKHQGKIKQQE